MTGEETAFQFSTCFNFVELTTQAAHNLEELAKGIEAVSGSSIFYHTHQYLLKHHFSTKMYGNDFSHWVLDSLQEDMLAERLANIDIREFQNIRSLRDTLLQIIRDHLATQPEQRNAPPGEAFYFCNAITFHTPTGIVARDLGEFCDALKEVGTPSIYYHFFEARLRLEQNTDDFSQWIDLSLHEPQLANRIRNLDPYRYRLDELKTKILALVQQTLDQQTAFPRPFERILRWLKRS